ncbi:toxin of toxin-antitoxin system [Arachidicoccus ginsenosidimutans]|uniref:Txe/YoeB family addiction module toxin n=1 Tax=Arachidicoccus sp. BS20 TaxID=1850526 RepID=UPI0007F0DC67|nr:Txe/YoeB family addiction module toxin [Arachidicoccus sp. BS20]ANI88921.1 toxin of toxin-antitoxin system [Arachidicoccus sp. BS20]
MEIIYSSKAKQDLDFWKKSGNKKVQKKISELIEDILIHPYEGIGKPEALKENLSGFWSRRITKEDRLIYHIIYKVEDSVLSILSLKGHYNL